MALGRTVIDKECKYDLTRSRSKMEQQSFNFLVYRKSGKIALAKHVHDFFNFAHDDVVGFVLIIV